MSGQYDVIVIGGGTAGLVTASGCARLGRKVALIEREKLGGDCLWTGCVPTKALVASAKLAHSIRNASQWGLETAEVKVRPADVMESMRAARHLVSHHDDPEKFKALGIEVIRGVARLIARDTVDVGGRQLTGKDLVIATGSRTAVPPVAGLAEAGFVDHVSFLERNEFPESVLILGGGAIGIEFAQMLRRFGSEVTVVEMLDQLAVREDADVSAGLRQLLEAEGIRLLTSWTAKAVHVAGGKKIATIADANGRTQDIAVTEIFVASGRRGNTEGLGLEELGVRLDRSYIAVDRYLQTSVARVWACGDVHGGLQFTHVAAYEAVKLVRNLLFPGKSAVDYQHIPWAIFTDPEAAHIGMTESEARAIHGDEVRIYRAEMSDVDRAITDRTPAGFIKLVCGPKGRLLGAHALCSNASTLIEVLVLARKKNVTVGELAQLVSPYPSLADAVQRAAAEYYRELSSSWIARAGRVVASWSQG